VLRASATQRPPVLAGVCLRVYGDFVRLRPALSDAGPRSTVSVGKMRPPTSEVSEEMPRGNFIPVYP
jgi:hypothetical protein